MFVKPKTRSLKRKIQQRKSNPTPEQIYRKLVEVNMTFNTLSGKIYELNQMCVDIQSAGGWNVEIEFSQLPMEDSPNVQYFLHQVKLLAQACHLDIKNVSMVTTKKERNSLQYKE